MTNGLQLIEAYLERFGYLDSPLVEHFGFARRKAFAAAGDVERALMHFQRYNGLDPTGRMDDATLALMQTPRCGFVDVGQFVLTGNKWPSNTVSYRINNYTPDLPQAVTKAAIAEAFKIWRDQCNLEFTEAPDGADIEIRFAAGEHGDGVPFDGASGVLAHAFFPGQGAISGDTHFDEAEAWTVTGTGIDLVTVAAHEFGHALGLAHTNVQGALMYPYYGGPMRELHADDKAGIRSLYGARVTPPAPPKPETDEQALRRILGGVSQIDMYFTKTTAKPWHLTVRPPTELTNTESGTSL